MKRNETGEKETKRKEKKTINVSNEPTTATQQRKKSRGGFECQLEGNWWIMSEKNLFGEVQTIQHTHKT